MSRGRRAHRKRGSRGKKARGGVIAATVSLGAVAGVGVSDNIAIAVHVHAPEGSDRHTPTIATRVLQKMGSGNNTLKSPEGKAIARVMLEVLSEEYGPNVSVSPKEKPLPRPGAPKEEWRAVQGVTKKWRFPDGSIIVTNWIDIPEKVYCDYGFANCWCRWRHVDPACKESHTYRAFMSSPQIPIEALSSVTEA